jgi:hypothetical protein
MPPERLVPELVHELVLPVIPAKPMKADGEMLADTAGPGACKGANHSGAYR